MTDTAPRLAQAFRFVRTAAQMSRGIAYCLERICKGWLYAEAA
jgi:hypothetical protein